jgi:hypothetical protein
MRLYCGNCSTPVLWSLSSNPLSQRVHCVQIIDDASMDVDARTSQIEMDKLHFATLSMLTPSIQVESATLQLMINLLNKYSHYIGVVVQGPTIPTLHPLSENHDLWGMPVLLPSSEQLYMRVSPKSVLTSTWAQGENGVDEEPPLVWLATRLCCPSGCSGGHAIITVALLINPNAPFINNYKLAQTPLHRVACRNINVIPAGLFRRHDPTLRAARSCRCLTGHQILRVYDDCGCEVLPASTQSVCPDDDNDAQHTKKNRKARTREVKGDSSPDTLLAAATTSTIGVIAGELLKQSYDAAPCENHSLTLPITRTERNEEIASKQAMLESDVGDKYAAESAISSAMSIIDLLSAETLVSLRANPVFKHSLPDYLILPNGLSLMLAMAVRLAIDWKRHNLPSPSACDCDANDTLRMIYCSAAGASLPGVEEGYTRIDVVIRMAIQMALVCNRTPPQSGSAATNKSGRGTQRTKPITNKSNAHVANVLTNKLFWQRVGQRLITRNFGLAQTASSNLNMESCTPSCFHSVLEQAHINKLLADGILCEGADNNITEIIPRGLCQGQIVSMLLDVDQWLHNGTFNGTSLDNPMPAHLTPDLVEKYTHLLSGILSDNAPGTIEADALFKPKTSVNLHANIVQYLNYNSCSKAIAGISDMLIHGARPDLSENSTHPLKAYVVGPSQNVMCCDCDKHIHVLEGTLMSNAYGRCESCFAQRCFDCTSAHAAAINSAVAQAGAMLMRNGKSEIAELRAVGKRCRRCGAEPCSMWFQRQNPQAPWVRITAPLQTE